MSAAYDQAVATLYRAPHESFVAERQRLSATFKANDDKAAAARLAKLPRPSISAWAVNQLWWHSRDAFLELFETAEQLRAGKLAASAAHRKTLAKLTTSAQQLLLDSGHGGSDATLRRVSMTLSGLAASGSFDPEPAGALSKDRDPPGFEAFGMTHFEPRAPAAPKHESGLKSAPKHEPGEAKRAAAAQVDKARAVDKAHAAAEKRLAAERHAKHQAKLRQLETAVRDATRALGEHQREHARLEKELASAERDVARARATLKDAEARVSEAKKET